MGVDGMFCVAASRTCLGQCRCYGPTVGPPKFTVPWYDKSYGRYGREIYAHHSVVVDHDCHNHGKVNIIPSRSRPNDVLVD